MPDLQLIVEDQMHVIPIEDVRISVELAEDDLDDEVSNLLTGGDARDANDN